MKTLTKRAELLLVALDDLA